MRVWLPLLSTAAVACGPHSHGKAPPLPPPQDPHADAVRAGLEPLYERGVLEGGMVVALIEPGHDPAYFGFGHTAADDPDPPDSTAIFEIGAVSKILTGLLLADEVARGEVTLDTPAAQLVPFGVRFPDADGVRPTLGDLASHRAGLPLQPDNLVPGEDDPFAGYGEPQLYRYLEYAQLQSLPGTQYMYSNIGYGLLGYLLSRKIGMPYEEAVETRVLSPLGLDSTWIAIPDSARARFVPGTRVGGEPAAPWTFDVLAGAAAWRSTAHDMAALVQAAAAAAAGKGGPFGDVLRASFQPLGEAPGDMEIAIGWHITEDGIVWHNGMTGGYASFIGFDPKTQRGTVVMASTASPLISKIGMALFGLLAGQPLDLELGLVDVPSADLDRLVGSYRLRDRSTLDVVRTGDALYIEMGDQHIRLFPRSPTDFLVLALSGGLEFVIDDDVVRGFTLHLPEGDVDALRVEP